MPVRPAPTHSPLGRRLPLGLAALALSVGALTACSGGEAATGSGSPTAAAAPTSSAEESPAAADVAESQTLTATESEMSIELSSEDLAAGSYTIEVVNEGSATHDFVVERDGADVAGTDTIAPGAATSLTVDLEPGTYVFYCSVGTHRAQGMEVTVTVT